MIGLAVIRANSHAPNSTFTTVKDRPIDESAMPAVRTLLCRRLPPKTPKAIPTIEVGNPARGSSHAIRLTIPRTSEATIVPGVLAPEGPGAGTEVVELLTPAAAADSCWPIAGGDDGSIGAPHQAQKRSPGEMALPHIRQNRGGSFAGGSSVTDS